MYPQNPKKTINRILEQANPFYHLFACYNEALNNDTTAYNEKCRIITEIWKTISKDYDRHKIQDIVQVMEWGKHHTFDIVLDGRWNQQKDFFEDVILVNLKQCEQDLVKIHKQFQFYFQGLIKVIQHPWDNVLRGMLQTSERNELTQKEIAYFANESGYATSMRIKKLVDDQCEDFAINLCSSYLKCLKLFEEGKVTLAVTEDQKKYAFDIYVALLYKVKRMETMFALLKALSDKEAIELVGRFSSKNAVNCKVWKSSYKVTLCSAMVFLHRHTQLKSGKPEDRQTVLQIMNAWMKIVDSSKTMEEEVLKALKSLLFSEDTTSFFVYTMIEGLKLLDVKHTRIEFYIRALNKDLNRLETLRAINELTLVLTVSQELAEGLLKLATELDDHLTVARECVLTAFSLNPTKPIFDLIEKMAVRCGLKVLDTGQWECKFHAPIEPDKTTIECQSCKKHMKAISLRAFNTNTILSEALTVQNVGLPQELCDDLIIILCSPRYQLLSWLQDWCELYRLCIMYLDNPEKTKNYITELKFVEIDYSLFQKVRREPQEISLGYDNVLEESNADDSGEDEIQFRRKKNHNKRRVIRDSSDDEEVDVTTVTPSPIKSDPEVLKSLRSFRKRKSEEMCTTIPAKIATAETDVTSTSLAEMLAWNHLSFTKMMPIPEENSQAFLVDEENNSNEEALDLSKNNNNNSTAADDFDPFQEIDKILQSPYSSVSENVSNVIMEEPYIEQIVEMLPAINAEKKDNAVVPAVSIVTSEDEESPEFSVIGSCLTIDSDQSTVIPEVVEVCTDSSECNEENVKTEEIKDITLKKPILEDVTQITKDNIDVSVIEEIIGQKIVKKEKIVIKQKTKTNTYLEQLLNQPKYKRSHKPTKFEDYLYDFPEYRRKKQDKHVDTNKNEIAQDTVNDHEADEEKRNETSPNVLKSDNYHTGQKHSLYQDLDVKEHTNQEKSLFREKGSEGFFTEETGKIVKKPHRDSNENKENSVYISKRIIKGKIKKKPKKHRRVSKSEEKETESDQEMERIRFSKDLRLLQDVKVVLDRIILPDGQCTFSVGKDPEVFKMCQRLNKKLPRRPFSDKNQRAFENWRCRNPHYSDVDMHPKVFLEHLKMKRERKMSEKKISFDEYKKKTNYNVGGNNNKNRPNIRNTNNNGSRKNNTGTNNAKNVLANVPGMKDTKLIQPPPVANVVQVVQMTGRSSNSSSTSQTSTQVTPHIQRIGQPRQETSNDTAATSSGKITTNAKPVSTQSSLINILPHTLFRTSTGAAGRTPPVINILSNQIIRPATSSRASTTTRTTTTATTTMHGQSSNNTNRSSGESQLINQLTNPSRGSSTTGGGSTIKVATSSEPSRIVQFVCQSPDGKLIPVSSFAQNCVVKVASSQNISPTSPNYEENIPKAVKSKSSEASADSESSETLPKFQQAFGKSVYQSKPTGTNSTNITNNIINHEVEKPKITVVQKSIVTTTTTTTSVKPIPGGVIYTRQVQSGQTINLIPQSRGQVFRIATSNSDQISVVKDTLIQNKMNALLAAALSKKDSDDSESEKQDETTSSSTAGTTRVAIARPGLVQNARIVKPVLQIPSNVIRNTPQNMSSTTLEQLREFDMVYKQVKERSSTTPASEASANSETSESQCISVTYLNQGQKINCAPIVVVSNYNAIQPVSSPALSVVSQGNTSPRVTPSPSQTSMIPKVTPKTSKGKTVKTPAMQNTAKASPIPKPQQKPQEDEHTTQRIFDILAEYAEQLRNSPDLNNKPAPRRRSNPPTNPSQNSKRKKSSSSKKPTQSNSTLPAEPDTEDPRTLGSEDSSCGVMQLSVPDDEHPTTLASTSESNDSTSTPRQQLILTDSSNQPRNLIIAESSVGEALKMPNTAVLVPGNYIMPVSMVKGGQQIAVVSGGSKILATVPARSGPNMLLFQSFLNQNRKTSVPTVKYSTIQPISGISSQSLAGVTAQPPVILPPLSHSISTVTLGQPITVKKLDNSGQVNTELLLTISQSRENDSSEDTPQPDSSTNVVPANIETVEIEETTTLSDNSSEKSYTPYQKPLITTPIATPVIAQTSTANTNTTPPKEETLSEQSQSTTQTVMTLNIAPIEQKGESRKTEERIQTVLVTASSSNGSMITQTRANFKDNTRVTNATQQNKDDFLRNNDKRNNEPKNLQSNNVYPQQGKIKKVQVATQRLDRELQQLCLQRKQAALERELRLQKSLSEECEDLGVDEPSTSDLFPEAELLFDSNHSPSFEQTSDVTKRIIVQQEGGKEEAKLTLFSDDDFLFEAGEYQKGENTAEYDGRTNGQSTEAGSPCEDATLLRTCTSMSDVTLNSPISPDTFHPTTPPPLHKYVHKYSNRKKSDKTTKQVDNWTGEVSSSEDTTGSNEIKSNSPEICLSKVTEEELADGNFKVVRVAIAKRECGDCSEEGDCSLSGRGARRSVKKLCSCCNGASSQDSRKRPAQPHQHVPVPQKKVFPVKKR